MNCDTCTGPLIWSTTHTRMWCAVYGTHPDPTPATRPHGSVVTSMAMWRQANNLPSEAAS